MGRLRTETLPPTNLLLYLSAPNSTGKFLLPADADIRAATGWVSGVGNIFYDTAGDPIAVLASEIAAWSSINQWNVLFHLVSADTESGRLAIYDVDTPLATLNKALKVLREDQIDLTPTAYFNGVFTPTQISAEGGTYTGGPTSFADNLGVFKTAPSGTPALQGMRLATTIADGAVLGPELFINGTFESSVGILTNSSVTISAGVATFTNAINTQGLWKHCLTDGKEYLVRFEVIEITSGAIRPSAGSSWNGQSVYAPGLYEQTLTATGVDAYIVGIGASTNAVVDNVSFMEIVPTYYDTALDGTPLLSSVQQPTRTFDAGFTTSTQGPTYKRYTRTNPAVDLPGYLCEPARTNKCTCRKANPVDTTNLTKSGDAASVLRVVDDTAALTAAGLIGVCTSGKVYKLDNSTGVAVSYVDISGTSGNANPHSISLFARGSGNVRIAMQNSNPADSSMTPVYQRFINTVTPSSAGLMSLRVAAGAVVYFILPQLEEGPFCTSPICKLSNGSDPLTAITSQGTVLSFPTAGKIRPNNMVFLHTVVPRATGQSGIYVFGNYTDANNYTAVIVDATTITYRKRVAGANTDATVSVTHTKDTPLQILRVGAAAGMQITARTYSGGAWSAWTNGELNSSDGAKANAIIAANYQLGALNSASQFTGNFSELDTLLIPDGIADPLAWAKQQWGLPA